MATLDNSNGGNMANFEFKELNYVNTDSLDQLGEVLQQQGYLILEIEGKNIKGKTSFLKYAAQTFEMETTPETFEAFGDYLWQVVVDNIEEQNIAVVWTHAEKMLEAKPEEFAQASATITVVTGEVVEQSKKLQLFLVGKGDKFPTL